MNDIATCILSLCPAADTSDATASSPMLELYQGRETQSQNSRLQGLTQTGNSSSIRGCGHILALQSGTCPALCISQVLQPRTELT